MRDAAEALADYTFRYPLPAFFLESFIFGAVSAAILFCGYLALRRGDVVSRTATLRAIIVLSIYILLVTHWCLAYRSIFALKSWIFDGGLEYDKSLPIYTYETVLFGTLTAFFLYSCFTFWRKGRFMIWNLRLSLPFLAIVFLFTSATLHWVTGMYAWVAPCLPDSVCPLTSTFHGNLYAVLITTTTLNVVVGDAVVLWRACAVWANPWRMVWLSFILVFGCTVCGASNTLLVVLRMKAKPTYPRTYTVLDTGLGFVTLGISLCSNFFAMAAVGYKAWVHRKGVRNYLTNCSHKLLTEKVLMLFLESGAFYAFIWIFYFTINILSTFTPLKTWESFAAMVRVYENGVVQLIAIYPIAVIILVSLESMAHDTQSMVPTLSGGPMMFATMLRSLPGESIAVGGGSTTGVESTDTYSTSHVQLEREKTACDSSRQAE